MDKDRTSIIVDVEDGKLCAYDDGYDVIWKNYSSIELSALLEEIPRLSFNSISGIDDNDVVCVFGDEEIIFKHIDKLREFKEFEIVDSHLNNEQSRLVDSKQIDKLKNRKSKKLTKIAAFALATVLVLPSGLDANALSAGLFSNVVSYNQIVDDSYSIDNLDTMVLQGVCTVGDNTFITAYDSSWRMKNSVVYVLDKNNECIKKVKLYNNSHVGGICYDEKNEMFWITDKYGTISGYTYDSIFYDESDKVYPKYRKVDVGSKDLINYKGWPSVAYITYHDGKLFLGNFTTNGKAVLKSFDIKDDGSVDLSSCKKAKFIDKVQGISFYEKDGFDYLLVSTSYGQRSKSELKIFKYDDMCSDYTDSAAIKMDMPPMMEQITFNSKGNLIAIFESNASKFKRVRKNNSDVVVTNIEPVVNTGYFKIL